MSIARMSAAVAPTPGLLALQKAEQFDRHLGAGGAPDENVNRAPVFARRSTPPIRVSDIIRTGRTARTASFAGYAFSHTLGLGVSSAPQ
jgi:hypothetical protein